MAEFVAEIRRGRVNRLAVEDLGDPEGLYRKYGLSEDHIAARALELLED